MESQQVARRYARGLFGLTQEQGVSKQVHEEINDVATILEVDDSLVKFLAAPQIVDKDKAIVMEKVFKGKVADQLYGLLQLLVDKHRTGFFSQIAQEYTDLFNKSSGIVATRLITAVPLEETEISQIRSRLQELTGKTIDIAIEVDAAIIGGAIAFVGDKIIDRSIRHELNVLRDQLLELKVH
jgi:F-type H+-transporting ATPase subunit delta